MFTDAQILYLEEVLGASLSSFRPATVSSPGISPTSCEVAVVTSTLSVQEETLLTKILASVELESFVRITSPAPSPQGVRHILEFGASGTGRRDVGPVVHWGLPSLSLMVGAGAEVGAVKKQAWALLQEFSKERQG